MSDTSSRITGLDGLRGFASLAVVLYHLSLIARPGLSEATWAWLTQSPLKLLFPGTESVLVFFALSGLVVALPALRPDFEWTRYYPSRLMRLYLPVFGALIFASILIIAIPRDALSMPSETWLRDAQATSVTPISFLAEASLLPSSFDIDNVLWSLRWELFFSLLLPLFVWLAIRFRRASPYLAVIAASATVAGRIFEIDALVYFPVFLLGTIIAINLDGIRAFGQRVRTRMLWPAVAVLSATLLIASWLARPFVDSSSELAADALWGLAGVGATLIVLLVIVWPVLRRACERPTALWLGKLSFSLYLVHAPVLGTLGYLLGQERWWLVCLIGLPVSLGASMLFYRWIERPSHLAARRVGGYVTQRLQARSA
ncbi:acyltransferase family protein [Microbacterium murale]|uniref:Peptidoglycan/LPS O-acetylase OafA/YrhL n=1 Tax=Microbacterium murale TaxID=1081040 RepID=A0ABU0PD06_9MICO|nr:acyltransferase [Microbacterium murale]MDQ0645216.1 peptidoglycan/LPS O-acetylase OafA/YrhL [Microbacterium murale]